MGWKFVIVPRASKNFIGVVEERDCMTLTNNKTRILGLGTSKSLPTTTLAASVSNVDDTERVLLTGYPVWKLFWISGIENG